MSLPNSQGSGTAEVLIDYDLCTCCGACADVCIDYPLYIENNRLEVDQTRAFGCMACGACVAVCPTNAIRISGRGLFPEDIFRIPAAASRADYDQLQALLLSRRSTRRFREEEVGPLMVQKILDAASTAPVGIPPSDVGVLVFETRNAVKEVCALLLKEMQKWRWMFSPLVLTILSPFIGKENTKMYKDFMAPAIEEYSRKAAMGEDLFFYDAPLAIYFYGTPYTDPADAVIPATYAMLAGEALGLGTCMLGFPGYIFQYSAKARKQYNLPKKIQPGLMVIFGYPKYKNRNAVKRRFGKVSTYL